MKKYTITKKFLIQEYLRNQKTMKEIAQIKGCARSIIGAYLKKFNIRTRKFSQKTIDACKQTGLNNKRYSKILTYKTLYRQYVINKKSLTEVAKFIGCGRSTVGKYLNEYKIHIRSIRESHLGGHHKPHSKPSWCKGLTKYTDKRLYLAGKKSSKSKIGTHLGIQNPNWLGGISKLPYPFKFNQELKEKIRKRDEYQCQNKECNMTEEEHLVVYGRVLTAHHIDYIKNNCNENNLISTCIQCNFRANYNRDMWKEYYQEIIASKGVLNGK